MASKTTVRIDGPRARLTGVLDRDAVVALWPRLQALPGSVSQLDLAEVDRIDSAGLALLAELTARARADSVTARPDRGKTPPPGEISVRS